MTWWTGWQKPWPSPLTELLPAGPSPQTDALLREQARRLFEAVLQHADRETLLMLNPLLVRLAESPTQRR